MPPRIGPRKPVRVYFRQWREKLGMTQQQVGDKIGPEGVSKGTVSRWESYEPGDPNLTLGVIAAYAEALNRPVTDMYHVPPEDDAPPSLDRAAEAAGLDKDDRDAVMGTISRMAHRRAS
jgi:transcriptional regulator with XRE-family HTH domain